MNTSIDSPFDDFPAHLFDDRDRVEVLQAEPLPAAHSAEVDLFDRQRRVPGHHQLVIDSARVVLAGAGGLNSWVAAALLRAGFSAITIIDPDTVERTNLTRQLFYREDLGHPKAVSLANNVIPHSVNAARITAIPLRFEEAAERYPLPADILIVGVDNNACRQEAVRFARRRGIPAVFSMLSQDGLRCNVFLQGAGNSDPCLWCALPNLDVDRAMPCAAAFIPSCFLASAFTLFFVFRALMGWPEGSEPFNWREADLFSLSPERTGLITRRSTCPVCAGTQ
jgi:molybdopterin/thiamine biosynthesis adenylyltransferase